MSGTVRRGMVAWALVAAGCSQEELPGEYFDVTAQGIENLCTGSGPAYNEKFEYRLVFEGNDLTIAMGEDVFATGLVEGCHVSYASLVWSSYRDDLEIEWQIVGSADIDVGGGGGCVTDSDWAGTEEYVIITSEHPDVSPGCTFTLDLTGKWLRSVE